MRTILDFKPLRRRYLFRAPRYVIQATSPEEVPTALDAIDGALTDGYSVAGWLSYELGYAIEPKLVRLTSGLHATPLIMLGVYEHEASATDVTGAFRMEPPVPEWSIDDYRSAFDAIHRYICAGDIYQANLSFRARFKFLGDPLDLYERLRATAAADYCAYVDDGRRQIASPSPEMFFSVSPNRRISTSPMKGTAPRDADDELARGRLAKSVKDRAENLMIVDLIRNDLSRIAQGGSVRVDDLFSMRTYPRHHGRRALAMDQGWTLGGRRLSAYPAGPT